MSLSLGNTLKVLILFIHAWSGCDTTSSIYGQEKTSIMKKLQKSKHLREICSLFGTDGATQAQIFKAGLSLFCSMLWWKCWRFLNPSFTKGRGSSQHPKGFSLITFEQNNPGTSNLA